MKYCRLFVTACALLSIVACKDAAIEPTSTFATPISPSALTVEGNVSPLNVHNSHPRLSWHANVARQYAYHIQVASSPERLHTGKADLWDSGEVIARASLNIPYAGNTLAAQQSVYWRVRVWPAQDEEATAWSSTGHWEMGLLTKDDWQADWIQSSTPYVSDLTPAVNEWIALAGTVETEQGDLAQPAKTALEQQAGATLLRHQFTLDKPIAKARLHSTAGGYYDIYVNGKLVDNRLMDPGQTDFDKRILYNTDDVSQVLSQGHNSVAIHLGSGWYHENIAFSKPDKNFDFGQPAAIAQLNITFTDGSTTTLGTNSHWKSHASPILKEGIFSGEMMDASQRIEGWNAKHAPKNYSQWHTAKALAQWPTQHLEPQLQPPIRPQKTLQPIKLYQPKPNTWVWDFGQNFTALPTVNIRRLGLKPGQSIYLRYAEWADNDGNISQLSGGGWATHLNAVDGYTAAENATEYWRPNFTWRGFRYVEIQGLTKAPTLSDISAALIRSDVKNTGHFTSSNQQLNRIHKTALWSYESNLMSVPLDCPVREKAGWTGDAHAALITGNYNYDMQTFWRKYLGDFRTALHIAPAVVPGKRTTGEKIDWQRQK